MKPSNSIFFEHIFRTTKSQNEMVCNENIELNRFYYISSINIAFFYIFVDQIKSANEIPLKILKINNSFQERLNGQLQHRYCVTECMHVCVCECSVFELSQSKVDYVININIKNGNLNFVAITIWLGAPQWEQAIENEKEWILNMCHWACFVRVRQLSQVTRVGSVYV